MITTSERLDILNAALSIARAREDYALINRLTRAITDVVCNTVLDRTEKALQEARRITA
jgi:hypothetical protein